MRWRALVAAALALAFVLAAGPALAAEGQAGEGGGGESASPGGGESYLDKLKKDELLAPYRPGLVPGREGQREGLGRGPGAPGAPKPLPSPLDPLQRRRRRPAYETEPKTGGAAATPAGPDLASTRLSREKAYRVSYTGPKPNSFGVPLDWQVRITDLNGMPVTGAHLGLRLSMPRSGHAPVVPGIKVRELGGGLYQVSGLRFDRRGWWQVALEVHGRGYGDTVVFNLMVP